MSVIFGIKEENAVIIAGDNRGSAKDGRPLTDSLNKVIAINKHLAFASAGNAAIGTAIQMDVNKINNEEMTTDELLVVIRDFYQRVNDTKAMGILALPFYFLLAGKNMKQEACLFSGGIFNGELNMNEVPMALYPPADVDIQACCNFFAENYKLHHPEFVERTIHQISQISKFVSATGNKWIFNMATGTGTLHSF